MTAPVDDVHARLTGVTRTFDLPSGAKLRALGPIEQEVGACADHLAHAIVGLLLSWITKSNGIGSIFNGVVGRVLKWIT